ncbi:storkhead-box protein 1 [Erpetoichthys calabaricus]|uniref:Storkhead box 1 n=1 Tax=Erpetoichthys calabaricus TaxID=27687 RepID=A0A8C4SCE2_ERPCA|nr:storkhead-box protein 1 [Erpetoichthys calabaricus]
MSQPSRVVQLSATSLALVLCKDDGHRGDGTPSGQEIFSDFKAQNLQSFWNKRLVKAMAEVHFQGWMDNCVLLVQGRNSALDVLREAWMRRALRHPKGFVIRAVGDVTPVQMSPIAQSQFIPLSEVLCSVISDMNVAHVIVNQESLIESLRKQHPGLSIPTQDILYNALGTLIKERKVYHTGEGYFIVTPQTYFITNSLSKDSQKWLTIENEALSVPPITYLVSAESCTESVTETIPTVAHCKSCRCFDRLSTQSVQDQQSLSESALKSQKSLKDAKPTVQHQSTSTAADYRPRELSKSSLAGKEKERFGKRFSLSLFRRNTTKKEKPKKEYATYSGQFPPEEWPVRDEDNLNNLPRDLEHEIIKRINPSLTVDNLVRHTIMMRKLEEQSNFISKGTTTEILATKQRQLSKNTTRKPSGKANKHRKKGNYSREKHRAKNKLTVDKEDNKQAAISSHSENRIEYFTDYLQPDYNVRETEFEYQRCNEVTDVESKNLYKKQIDNPFQGMSVRDTSSGRSHKHQDLKRSRSEKPTQRSKSWDSSRTKVANDNDAHAVASREYRSKDLNYDVTLDIHPVKEYSGDYGSHYPESSTLRIEEKFVSVKGGSVQSGHFYEEANHEARLRTLPDKCTSGSLTMKLTDKKNEASQSMVPNVHSLPPQITYQCDTAAVLLPWQTKTANQNRLSSIFGQEPGISDHLSTCQPERKTKSLRNGIGPPRETKQTDSEGFSDDEQAVYQQPVDEDDACSSLCLNEDSEGSEFSETSQQTPSHYRQVWNNAIVEVQLTSTGIDQCLNSDYSSQQEETKWKESHNRHVANLSAGIQLESTRQSLSQFISEHEEDVDCGAQQEEVGDCSIFDYCQASEADSDAETVQKSIDEGDGKSTCWNMDQETEEMLRKEFEQKVELLHSGPSPILGHDESRETAMPIETVENHSITGDSGIDSPRARVILTSNNTAFLEGLKRRSFLQNLENLHSKNNAIRPQSSLLQLTPVINV